MAVRTRALASIVLLALAMAAGTAHAAVFSVGSRLTKPANLVEAHGADALFFDTSADGLSGAMPADGQVTLVRVKGSVVDNPSRRTNPHPPNPTFHFQVLRPLAGFQMRVALSSAPFKLPIVTVTRTGALLGNPQAINSYAPVNMCVHKGDFLDFNDIGGSEWSWGGLDGMHVRVFSGAPSSVTGFFSKAGGTNIGSQWVPQAFKRGEELLMQARLGTGPNATDFCPGGYRQHVFTGLQLGGGTVTLTSAGTVKLGVGCPGQTYGACLGLIVMKATIGGQPVTLGGAPFAVKPGFGASSEIQLSAQNAALVRRLGRVTATVTATGHDAPTEDSRAQPGIPVQRKTTTATVTVVPG